jgi:MinD superfamily P-loop ATPase
VKQITILSGKGGVGKSSITASLAIALSKKNKIACADCDVDASNLALVLGLHEKDFSEWKELSTNEKAVVDAEKCIGCKKCIKSCYFNAISWDAEKNIPSFDGFACEGCGTCGIVCPQNAISLEKVNNAKIGFGKTRYGFNVFSAQLNIGESGSGKVVAEVKKMALQKSESKKILLVDSAAGIGCPVIASVAGSNYALAVTEPSPSAFSDFKRAIQIVEHFGIPYGAVINKSDLNPEFSEKMEKFCKEKEIEILAKIPFDKSFSNALNELVPVIEFNPKLESVFGKIAEKIERKLEL